MKKQIILVIIAVVASFSISYGQLQPSTATSLSAVPTACFPATPVSCPSTALKPVPGSPYTYSIEVPNNLAAGATFKYRWFVTQDPNVLTTTNGVTSFTPNIADASGSGSLIQSAVADYNDLDAGDPSITIIWKSFVHDPTQPVLVVVYVEGTDECVTNNIEVYQIEPIHAFTLDIGNIAANGEIPDPNPNYETCVSPVESAVWTAGSLTMDYGTNYLYYIVNAANFTDSWMPSFQLSGHGGRIPTIEWQYPALANVVAGWNSATTPVVASGGAGSSVGPLGECIIVRVTLDNDKEETLAATDIILAVDGVMNDPTTPVADYTNNLFGDVQASDCAVTLTYEDAATQVLMPRPEVISTTPASPTDPAIQPFIPKN